MLDCQKTLFDIPDDVSFLSAASYSPLPKSVQRSGQDGVARKGQPWQITGEQRAGIYDRCRAAAAALIQAPARDVALVPSVSYGFATAAKLLDLPAGARVIVLENDHSSPVLEWMSAPNGKALNVDTVRTPRNGDWTSAVLEAIQRPGAPPPALASISAVHWADGGVIDLVRVAAALREHGAAFAIDTTQATGAMPVDVGTLDPDFVMFPTYKWLLGPYGRAFCYIAPRHQQGPPLEQTTSGRRGIRSEALVYLDDTRYHDDARRFDMGERDHFITMDMASLGMELIARLDQAAIANYTRTLTDALEGHLSGMRTANGRQPLTLDRRYRAPHILSVDVGPEHAQSLAQRLEAERIFVTARLGRLRIAPHVYNDDRDINRLVQALGRHLANCD